METLLQGEAPGGTAARHTPSVALTRNAPLHIQAAERAVIGGGEQGSAPAGAARPAQARDVPMRVGGENGGRDGWV